MSLTTPFSVQKLQTAMHAKAKESPDFRFYALYDKVYRKDVLAFAYERCKGFASAAGEYDLVRAATQQRRRLSPCPFPQPVALAALPRTHWTDYRTLPPVPGSLQRLLRARLEWWY